MSEMQLILMTAAILFSSGLAVILTKKNAVMVLMGIELLLNAANLNFIAFSRLYPEWKDGQFFALFVIVLAAAEAAVGLALVLRAYRFFKSVDLDKMNEIKG